MWAGTGPGPYGGPIAIGPYGRPHYCGPYARQPRLASTGPRVGNPGYSTTTLFARLRGWSMSQPRRAAE